MASPSPIRLTDLNEPATTILTPIIKTPMINHAVVEVFSFNIIRLKSAVMAGAVHKMTKVLVTLVYFKLMTSEQALTNISVLDTHSGLPYFSISETNPLLEVIFNKLSIDIAVNNPNKKAASSPDTSELLMKIGAKLINKAPIKAMT